MAKVVPTQKPDSVMFDYHGNQLHHGGPFLRYIGCAGCGWSIGVGDAVGEVMHNECLDQQPPEVQAAWGKIGVAG